MIQVNAVGDACPIPVVKTLQALKTLAGPGTVETLVDNRIAVENLTRLAQSKGCTIETEQLAENRFRVTITAQAGAQLPDTADGICTVPSERPENTVVVISADHMGQGDDTLGRVLLRWLRVPGGPAQAGGAGGGDPDLRHLSESLRHRRQAPGGSGDQYVRHRREADERHPGDPALTRQRTPALVISFQETAQALAAEALFGRLSLPGRIIPLPSRISAGCGLAWKADPGDETVLTAALDENGIGHGPCCVLEMF